MIRAFRFAALVGILSLAAWLTPSNAHAGGWCRIWCDNGITIENGWSSSFDECQSSFLANCSQGGTYGGTFCYQFSGCYSV